MICLNWKKFLEYQKSVNHPDISNIVKQFILQTELESSFQSLFFVFGLFILGACGSTRTNVIAILNSA